MKRMLSTVLATVLLLPATILAASFEGKITFQMTAPRGEPQSINYSIKENFLRVEMPPQQGMSGAMVMNLPKNEMIMIMDAQRMYMVMPAPDLKDLPNAPKEGPEGETPTLEKTGEKEKILGYTAEKYISTYKDTKTELWLAEGIGSFMGLGQRGGPMGGGRRGNAEMEAWQRALRGKELFPLRVVGTDKNGKQSFKMEATSIEKQSLPDTLFTPPADYQRMDMGNMMKGMIPGAGARPPGGN